MVERRSRRIILWWELHGHRTGISPVSWKLLPWGREGDGHGWRIRSGIAGRVGGGAGRVGGVSREWIGSAAWRRVGDIAWRRVGSVDRRIGFWLFVSRRASSGRGFRCGLSHLSLSLWVQL